MGSNNSFFDDDNIIDITPITNYDSNETLADDVESDHEAIKHRALPTGLAMYKLKSLLAGIGLVAATAVLAIYVKSFKPLFFLLPAAFFLFRVFSINRRFNMGLIRGVPVLCTAVKQSRIRDKSTVTFRTAPEHDEDTEFFRFENIGKREADQFIPQYPYIIYFDTDNPHTLLGFEDL